MRLLKSLLFILLVSFSLNITGFSQDLLMRSPEGRYVSGIGGFMDMLRRNINFPVESANNNSMGFSVSSIEINPVGEIVNIKIINPVDPQIDALVKKTLAGTEGKWMNDRSSDENLFIVVQICFMPFPQDFIPVCESPVDLPAFLPPLTIINKVISDKNPLSEEALADILNRTRSYEDSDSALIAINELIKRNPFNPELYQLRIFLNKRRGNNELVINDLNKMANFAGGVSLQKLITRFYNRYGVEISEAEAVYREAFSDRDDGLKSVTRFNLKGDTVETAILSSVDPEIREGFTREFKNGILRRTIQYNNNHIDGYVTDFNEDGHPESITLVLMDTIRALLFSESNEAAIITDKDLFYPFDKAPSFKKGGLESFRKWYQKKLRYPKKSAEEGIQGKVYLTFIVEPDGSVSDSKVIYGSDPLLDEEALRVARSSPKWTPAYLSGKPVRAALTITANFQLQ